MAELRALCLSRLDPAAVASLAPERLGVEVERLLADIATDRRIQLNLREQRQVAGELVNDMLGLGPLQPLLDDESVADIMVNGFDRVFVERRGKVYQTSVRFRDAAHVTNVCQRIAANVGRRVDESSPMVDARLKDGSRVNIVLPPLALDGPYISIRKFAKKRIDFAKLIEFGALTPPVARVLEIAGRCRLNIIISGGTGSGKTTLLNAISQLIDPSERIVTVEDAAELQLQQPHVVRLETRPASLEGRGEVTQRDLVRNALRMRPDRIIVGEVRGGEAFDMLQAMNTGHDGSMSTIHANTSRDALTRIENMVQMGNFGLPSKSIRQQIDRGRQSHYPSGAAARRRTPGGPGDGGVRDGGRRCHPERRVRFRDRRRDERWALARRVPRQPGAAGISRSARILRPRPELGGGAGGDGAVSHIALVLFAGLLLTACFAGSLLLLRVDERLRRANGRRLAAIAPYSRSPFIIPALAVLPLSLPTASLGRTLRRCIGMDPSRPDPYPLSPWLVLPLAVLPGWIVRWLMHGLLGPIAWLLLPVCWIFCVRSVYRGSDAKRTATLLKQFPDALGTIARAVRVGIPIAEAMRAVARDAAEPTAGEFARVHDQVTIGTSLEEALRKLAARSRLPEYRFFATALSLQSQTGGGLTETLDSLADVIRKRVALKARGYALASEARTSSAVLASLPVLSGLALAVLNPAYIAPLLQEGPGQNLFGIAVLWLSLGLVVMRGLIRKSLS